MIDGLEKTGVHTSAPPKTTGFTYFTCRDCGERWMLTEDASAARYLSRRRPSPRLRDASQSSASGYERLLGADVDERWRPPSTGIALALQSINQARERVNGANYHRGSNPQLRTG